MTANARNGDLAIRLTELLTAASEGNLSERLVGIEDSDHLASAAHAANRLLDVVEANNLEVVASVHAIAQARYHRRLNPVGLGGRFKDSLEAVSSVLSQLVGRSLQLEETQESLRSLRDITGGVLGTQTSKLLDASEGLDQDSSAAVSLVTRSRELVQASFASAEEAFDESQNIASATEMLAESIQDIGRQSEQTREISDRALQEVLRAREVMSDVQLAAEAVASIVSVISEIARQTNLLALNAAIEAARAGEAGRGFGVVASEVKALAGQTRSSTRDIAQRIEGVEAAITRGRQTVEDISGAIEQLVGFISTVSTAIYEQSTVTQQINGNAALGAQAVRVLVDSLTSIGGASDDMSHAVVTLQSAAKELNGQVRETDKALRDAVERIDAELDRLVGQ